MVKQKHKVLFFLLNGVGGAERMTITISKFLSSEEFDVRYVVVCDGDDRITKFMPEGSEVSFIRVKNPYYNLTYKLYKCLKEEKPSAVFCASPAINARLIIASKLAGDIKVILRNSTMFREERWDVKWLVKKTYRHADKIILQQDEMREELHQVIDIPRSKTITLQNPLDVQSIEKGAAEGNPFPEDDKGIKYLSVGRISQEKGQDILLKAFSLVYQANNATSLYIVGNYDENGSFYQQVKGLVEDFNLANAVHFVGLDFNPYKWMKHCDCFVLPSRWEGLPNALIEAMSLERPAVSTLCVPIISRIIQDGMNGYICPIEDEQAMAEAMKKAATLTNCKLTYKPATAEDFVSLFQ